MLACGLAPVVTGCGAAPASADSEEHGRVSDENAAIQAKYPATWSVVQSFLRAERAQERRSVASTTELYRPDVEGPAYLEFALQKGQDDAGHIIASTGGHDFPIVAWSDRGPSVVRSLEKQHQREFGGARLFMTGPGSFVAESADGSVASSAAAMKPERWGLAKEQFVRARSAGKIESANRAAQAWRRVAKVSGAVLPSDVTAMPSLSGCVGDACPPEGANGADCLNCQADAEELVRGSDILWPPNYPQFSTSPVSGSARGRSSALSRPAFRIGWTVVASSFLDRRTCRVTTVPSPRRRERLLPRRGESRHGRRRRHRTVHLSRRRQPTLVSRSRRRRDDGVAGPQQEQRPMHGAAVLGFVQRCASRANDVRQSRPQYVLEDRETRRGGRAETRRVRQMPRSRRRRRARGKWQENSNVGLYRRTQPALRFWALNAT